MSDATEDTFAKAALSACGHVSRLAAGERAELRSDALGSAFWRVSHASGLVEVARSDDAKRDFVRILALLIGTTGNADLHNTKATLGGAMFAAGITAQSFERTLSSEFSVRRDMMTRHARRMARSAPSLNVIDLAHVVMSEHPEMTARKIARDYYAAEYAASSK